METYFKTDYIAIHHKPIDRIVIVEYRLPPTSREFRECMEEVIGALQHFRTGKVIFDMRRFGILLDQDQRWTAESWYPRAVKAGYCQVAFVNPPDIFTRISVEETTERVHDRIPTATFGHLSEALEWMVLGTVQKTATHS